MLRTSQDVKNGKISSKRDTLTLVSVGNEVGLVLIFE